MFPLPATFDHSLLNDYVFFVRDGDFGLRKVYDNGWRLGGVAKIQTLGFSSNESAVLVGMSRRDWTLQVGGTVGNTFGPLAMDVVAHTDVFGVHGGYEVAFKLATPFQGERWNLVPQVDVLYQSADLVDYYFGVTPAEEIPGVRPAYMPGSAVTPSASLSLAYRLNPRWYITASAALEFLPDEISASPIVDRDQVSRVFVGIAYDAPVFIDMHAEQDAFDLSKLEVVVGAYFVRSETNVDLRASGIAPAAELEADRGLSDGEWTGVFDAIWRLQQYHRLELSYFELNRSDTITPAQDIRVGDTIFVSGDPMRNDFNTRVFRFGYSFSLFHDEQKELWLFGGLHVADVAYQASNSTETVDASMRSVLPALGAGLRVSPTERLSAAIKLELFDMNFGENPGRMSELRISGQYQLSDRWGVGLAYLTYRQDIDSGDANYPGDYQFDYRGPVAYVQARF